MKKIYFIITGMVLLGIGSCVDKYHTCIHGNGNVASEMRDLRAFNEINSEDDFNVYIQQDSVNEVVVDAEENLLNYIVTSVSGSKLTLKYRDRRCIRNSEPVNIYIKTTDLNSVKLSGSGFIEIKNLNTTNIELNISGSGDIEGDIIVDFIDAKISGSGELHLVGETTESELKISGSGKMSLFGMLCEKCFADISGSGNIYVSVSDFLDVKISGSGSVFYIGQPAINVSISGSGSVESSN
ncbi:MAG: head GIN domain-containing protein [Bacteroidota bacterium]